MNSLPNSPRITLVVLEPTRRWRDWFNLAFILGWPFAVAYIVIGRYGVSLGSMLILVIAAGLFAYVLFGSLVMLFGREDIAVEGRRVTLTLHVAGLAWRRSFDRAKLQNIHVDVETYQRKHGKRFVRRLAFVSCEGTWRTVRRVSAEEGARTVDLIARKLSALE
jgi:hypothetical protein